MPDYRVRTCPLCEVVIETSPVGLTPAAPRVGLCLEIGFSNGGWGHRQDHAKFSAEVCVACHDEIMDALKPGLEMLAVRQAEVKDGRGRRRPGRSTDEPAAAVPRRLALWGTGR